MRPALFVVAALGLAACTGSLEHEVGDAGPTAPRYDPLDEDEATLALALSNDGQTARVDLRLSQSGEVHVIEVNPNPGLASDDEFAQAALMGGWEYPALIDRILDLGLRGR